MMATVLRIQRHLVAPPGDAMKPFLQLLKLLITGALFLVLFGFSLNNQTPVQVQFVFGWSTSMPLVMVVLISLGLGIALGVLGMLPHWLDLRRRQPSDSPYSPKHSPSVFADTEQFKASRLHRPPTTDYGP